MPNVFRQIFLDTRALDDVFQTNQFIFRSTTRSSMVVLMAIAPQKGPPG